MGSKLLKDVRANKDNSHDDKSGKKLVDAIRENFSKEAKWPCREMKGSKRIFFSV